MDKPRMPEDMRGMLTMLAGMPREERRFRQTEMLDMFFSMPEDRASMMMRPMAEAKLSLPEDQQLTLTESQLDVLAGYPTHKREWLLTVHKKVMEQLPEQDRARDKQVMERAEQRLEAQRHRRIETSIGRVMGPMMR